MEIRLASKNSTVQIKSWYITE